MRHHYNRMLEVNTGIQKKQNVLRNMITSLLDHGRITTTPKKAKVLRYEVEKLFAKAVRTYKRYENEADARREAKKVLVSNTFSEKVAEKALEDRIIPYAKENKVSGYARLYRVGVRKGDNVEKIMVELV